jgi:hypothetical protein
MNRIRLESCAQKCERIGRVRSLVSGLAWSMAPTGATQTFSTPSRGAMYESQRPSGLTVPATLLGFPKRAERGISGVISACEAARAAPAGAVTANRAASAAAAVFITNSFSRA